MIRLRAIAVGLILFGVLAAGFVYVSQFGHAFTNFPFVTGLDLQGGTRLTYAADVSQLAPGDVSDSMSALRDVIERRINAYGVAEPVVTVESGSLAGAPSERLNVELPGITDVAAATSLIGATPLLEFRSVIPSQLAALQAGTLSSTTPVDQIFEPAALTGSYISRAALVFDPTSNAPEVSITFTSAGGALFDTLTKENIGKPIGIFLDGELLSMPNVSVEIPNGQAVITGSFTAASAKDLATNLNYGALPVPISLISTEVIGPSLGAAALSAILMASVIAFAIVVLLLILWYRLPGLLAAVALAIYASLMLALFKLIPVTLTVSDMAGFIISIGMAVDANILIFERIKEELRGGQLLESAVREGFRRAWPSIRDSNISSMITAAVLYEMAPTTDIQKFALVFGLGVLVSMFTAITISRTFLLAIGAGQRRFQGATKFLFGSGFFSKNPTQ